MIRVDAYFDILGHPHFDVHVTDKNGRDHRHYPDAQRGEKPVGVTKQYWEFLLNAAFLQFATMVTARGSFKGKRWDVQAGIKHTDVLDAEEIDLIVRGQLHYDIITNGFCEKLGYPQQQKRAS